jgi:hypothetical protein
MCKLIQVAKQIKNSVKKFQKQMDAINEITSKLESNKDFIDRMNEIGRAASEAGLKLSEIHRISDYINKTKTMNERKKAKKEKKEEIAKLHIELMEACNKAMDYGIEKKNSKSINSFEIIAKMMGFAFQMKSIINQIKIVREKPLPPKSKSTILPHGSSIISEKDTERILDRTFFIKGEDIIIERTLSKKTKELDDDKINITRIGGMTNIKLKVPLEVGETAKIIINSKE